MKLFAVILYFLLFAGTYLKSQPLLTQTVKGQVVDQQSKSPIVGATVLLNGSIPITGAVTNLDGIFRLENVPVGRHNIILSSVGYETKILSNITVGSGKQLVLEVELIESLMEMEALEVVGDRQKKRRPLNEMATVSAISLSVEETSRFAATFEDPARAALSQAGVSTGGDDLLNEIVIRGNSPKGVLWRLEGVEIPNPNHFGEVGSSGGGISMLSGNLLSNSDFFTGAFPAQYGNATSGIFDLNLRKGNFDKREHAFQAGLLGIALASEGPFSKKGNGSYLVSYRYSTLALFNAIGIDVLGEQEDVRFQDLSFKVHKPTKKIGAFSLWGLGGINAYSFNPKEELGQILYKDNNQKMGVGGITHIAYLNENTFIESTVSISAQSNDLKLDSLGFRLEEMELIKESALRFSSFINHKFNAKNTLRIGGVSSRLNYNLKSQEWHTRKRSFVVFLDDRGSTNFYQGFAQWQHRVNENLTINSGFHVSHFALNQDIYLEPRVGFRWQSSSRGAVIGGAGKHSRMETLALYMVKEEKPGGIEVQANRDLGFTKALHAVLGYEYMINKDLRGKSEVYYQYLYDVPVWPTDTLDNFEALTFSAINFFGGYRVYELANRGTGRNYGVEFTLEKTFSNSYYFMSTASLYQSKYKGIDGVERNTFFNGNYIFNLLGGKEFKIQNNNNKINLNARFIWSGGKRQAPILLNESREAKETVFDHSRNFENKMKDYVRLDFGFSYKKNNKNSASIFAINVQNVLGIQNARRNYYSTSRDRVVTETQLGMFPNLSYRVEF